MKTQKNQSAYLGQRNVAIDLLRAITMATMLMVNDFWSVTGIPHWMHHAAWGEDMLGFSDLVFPTFLFCVGLSIPYAVYNMQQRGRTEGDVIRHILSRSFALLLMGAFICNYESGIDPAVGYDKAGYSVMMTVAFFLVYCQMGDRGWAKVVCRIAGWSVLLYLLVTSRSPEGALFHPSWWGILGLIGWAYLFCALVYALGRRLLTSIVVWVMLLLVCLLCSETADYSAFAGVAIWSLPQPNMLDLALSILHVGNASSHLLVMSGVLFSALYLGPYQRWTVSQRICRTMCMAALLVVAAIASHQLFIFSKLIGTLPWVFATLAIDVVLYLVLDLLVTSGRAHWLRAFNVAGTATLTCYMIPYVLYPLTTWTIGWQWSSAIPAPLGIVKCMAFSALCILITYALGKVRVKLRV